MNFKILIPLFIALISFGNINAQLRKSGNNDVYTKSKKSVKNNRRTDLNAYKNNVFIMDNAFKSSDMEKVVSAYNNIKDLAKDELTRLNNNLIDLYAVPNKSENLNNRIEEVEKRLKKMQQRYQIFTKSDIDLDANSKSTIYAYNMIKQFGDYMQQNFEEFDNGGASNSEERNSQTADVKVDLKNSDGGGMISSKSSSNSAPKRNSELKNPEVKKYIDNQRLNVSSISKKSRELIKSLSAKDYVKANNLKQSIYADMQKTVNVDKQMSKRIENKEFEGLELHNSSLLKTIESETKLLQDFNKLRIPQDNSKLMSIINDFNRLNRYL